MTLVKVFILIFNISTTEGQALTTIDNISTMDECIQLGREIDSLYPTNILKKNRIQCLEVEKVFPTNGS